MTKYQGFMFADNQRSIGLRTGSMKGNGDNNTAILTNSWFSAAARPTCDYCYGTNATSCKNSHAIRW